MANSVMKSVSGQTGDKTLAIYIASDNQVKLADGAIGALAAWEKGAIDTKKAPKSCRWMRIGALLNPKVAHDVGKEALCFKGLLERLAPES